MHKLRDTPGEPQEDLRRSVEEAAGCRRVYVLGLGNTDRADDGAGILVAEAMKKRFPRFSFSEHDGVEGAVLDISERKEEATVFFIDAADLKSSPGSIRVVRTKDIKETEITTHRVAVALMVSLLEARGKNSAVICIQAGSVGFMDDITEPVRQAIHHVLCILEELMSTRD